MAWLVCNYCGVRFYRETGTTKYDNVFCSNTCAGKSRRIIKGKVDEKEFRRLWKDNIKLIKYIVGIYGVDNEDIYQEIRIVLYRCMLKNLVVNEFTMYFKRGVHNAIKRYLREEKKFNNNNRYYMVEDSYVGNIEVEVDYKLAFEKFASIKRENKDILLDYVLNGNLPINSSYSSVMSKIHREREYLRNNYSNLLVN